MVYSAIIEACGTLAYRSDEKMKIKLSNRHFRLPIVTAAALTFLIFSVRSVRLSGEPARWQGLLFVIGFFGFPLLVLVFIVWSSGWKEITGETRELSFRNRMALTAEAMGAASAALFVLLLPFWGVLVVHSSLAELWELAGVLTSLLAMACAMAGSPKRWRPAIASALLLPFWFAAAALFVKALMD